jgi:hypothetical protein
MRFPFARHYSVRGEEHSNGSPSVRSELSAEARSDGDSTESPMRPKVGESEGNVLLPGLRAAVPVASLTRVLSENHIRA